MIRRHFALLVIPVLLLSLVGAVSAQEATETPEPAPALPHWNYEAGEEGPTHWGDLDVAYSLCSLGEEQSPIDIETEEVVEEPLEDIQFNYQPSALNLLNNRHTIQVAYDEGSYIEYDGDRYDLIQFHFHHPSEHTLNEESFAMELHLVHRDAEGNLAVVGVLLRGTPDDNATYAMIFDHLPTDVYDEVVTVADVTINAEDLLPETRTYYHYDGSLTTPPCAEGVNWFVLTEPVEISYPQLGEFAALYPVNRRPIQELGERELLLDSESGS